MRNVCLFLALICSAFAAKADETHRANVMICLSQMDQTTTWDRCRTMLFTPCAGFEVGNAAHLACLSEERAGWQSLIAAQQTDLNHYLRDDALGQFADLMTQWTGFVAAKCDEVAESRANISRAAALAGCEISEAAGLALELHTCLGGTSKAPYCALKE